MFCFFSCEYKKVLLGFYFFYLSKYGTISLVDNLQLIIFSTKNTREEVGTSMAAIRSCACSYNLKIPCQVDVRLIWT